MEDIVFWLQILCSIVTIMGFAGGYYIRQVRSQLGLMIEINGSVAVNIKQQLMNQVLIHQSIVDYMELIEESRDEVSDQDPSLDTDTE